MTIVTYSEFCKAARQHAARNRLSLYVQSVEWLTDGGQWVPKWTADVPPVAARVTVRTGSAVNSKAPDREATAVAVYSEFYQDVECPPGFEGCLESALAHEIAEVQALRMLFPDALGHMVADSEVGNLQNVPGRPKWGRGGREPTGAG